MFNPDSYREALRDLLQTKGQPVKFLPDDKWHRNAVTPVVSMYNWLDDDAHAHASVPAEVYGGEGCWWNVAPGAEVTEETYTEWGGTFGTDDHIIGINVSPVSCACGKYTNMTLRYEKSLSQTLRDLLGEPVSLLTL